MFEARHSHPSHWRVRIALLVFGTILSIAAAIFVLYWGACAHTVAPYAQSAASVDPFPPGRQGLLADGRQSLSLW